MCEGKQVFRYDDAVDVNKDLKQIKFPISIHGVHAVLLGKSCFHFQMHIMDFLGGNQNFQI